MARKNALGPNHRFDISFIKHLGAATNAFNPDINYISFQQDPGYGYDHVVLCLLEFRQDGQYGLCIYNRKTYEFIDEPGTLDDYGFKSLAACYAKYPRLRPSVFKSAWENRDTFE